MTDAWARLNAASSMPMLNRAIRQTYPPGSTFKIVTAAAALDERVVTDADAATDTPSPYVLPGTRTTLPNEARGCENASLADAIRVSCNTVMAHLGVESRPGGDGGDGGEVRLQRLRAAHSVRGGEEQLRHGPE